MLHSDHWQKNRYQWAGIIRRWLQFGLGFGLAGLMSACSTQPVESEATLAAATTTSTTSTTTTTTTTTATTQALPMTAEQQQRVGQIEAAVAAQQWPAATAQLEGLVAARPDDARLVANLGWLYQQQNKPADALDYYAKAILLPAAPAHAFNHLALLQIDQHQYQAAQKTLLQGLSLHTDSAELHYNLAVLNELYLLDLSGAATHYEAYQKLLDKPDAEVQGWLSDLKSRSGS